MAKRQKSLLSDGPKFKITFKQSGGILVHIDRNSVFLRIDITKIIKFLIQNIK